MSENVKIADDSLDVSSSFPTASEENDKVLNNVIQLG